MLKVNVYDVDDFGTSGLMFIFGYDKDKDEVVTLFQKDPLAHPDPFLTHFYQGKDGMFSAKDGKRFIEQLSVGMSYSARIWASRAYE